MNRKENDIAALLAPALALQVSIEAQVSDDLREIRGVLSVDEPGVWLADPLALLPDAPDDRTTFRTWPGAPERGEVQWAPAGEGRWQPFDPDQRAMLAESWLDDEFWLAAGAGGLATYHPHGRPASGTKHQPERAGHPLPPGLLGRGHGHGIEERRMVGSR